MARPARDRTALPIAWHLSVAAKLVTLPIEVLQGLVNAGAVLPVEWFADAMPDYSGGVFKLPRRGRVFCLDARAPSSCSAS